MNIKRYLFILLIMIQGICISSYEKYVDFDLIKNAGKPRFVNDGVLFTIQAEKNSIIFLRTSLDNWSENHYFSISFYGIYYVFIRITDEPGSFRYKINKNNYWIDDPHNDNRVEDMYGTNLSVIEIPEPEKERFHASMPIIEKTDNKIKNVVFKYYNPDANEVNLICSIDNWAQYSHPMKKDKFGYWTIAESFSKGMYLYLFYVDGNYVVDLENKNRTTANMRDVSYFIIR